MPASSTRISDSDVIFNRSLLGFGSGSQNLPSWLSSSLKADHGSTSVETDEEDLNIHKDDEEAGLGYDQPSSVPGQGRQSDHANDKLRRQLLGKNTPQRAGRERRQLQQPVGLSASKPKPQLKKRTESGSGDDLEGRTGAMTKRSKATKAENPGSNDSGNPPQASPKLQISGKWKRGTSYLDHLLESRQNKKGKGTK